MNNNENVLNLICISCNKYILCHISRADKVFKIVAIVVTNKKNMQIYNRIFSKCIETKKQNSFYNVKLCINNKIISLNSFTVQFSL